MPEPAGFASYVAARGDALHQTAYLMTGDHAAAEELLVSALAAAWPKWSRLAGDPEPFVQRALAQAVAPRWQRGTSREPVAHLAVDEEPLVDAPGPLVDPDDDPEQRAADRVIAVSRRVAARHRTRQRVGAGALAVVLVIAVVGGAKAVQQQRHPAPRAAQPVKVAEQPTARTVPTYYNGGRLLDSIKVDLSRTGTTTLPFTPTRWGLDFAYQCPTEMAGTAQFEIRVNGFVVLGSDCVGSDPGGGIGGPQVVALDGSSGDYGETNPAAQTFWSALGIKLGRPTTAVVTVTRAGFVASPPPAMTAVVYQDVPFADYPLPQRPARVRPPFDLLTPLNRAERITLPDDAVNGTWTARLPYRKDLVVDGSVSGPGQIEIRVDGLLVGGFDSYDYNSGEGFTRTVGPPLLTLPHGRTFPKVGQTITLTISVQHFTGPDWALQLGESTS